MSTSCGLQKIDPCKLFVYPLHIRWDQNGGLKS